MTSSKGLRLSIKSTFPPQHDFIDHLNYPFQSHFYNILQFFSERKTAKGCNTYEYSSPQLLDLPKILNKLKKKKNF